MQTKLSLFLALTLSLSLAGLAGAQTCPDIHGDPGCAPSPLDGQVVTLTGVVYAAAGTYNSGSVYWQCAGGGGMTFFENGAPYALGDEIEVSGTVGAFGDEIQINGAVVTLLSSGNAFSPNPIGTGDLADGTDMLGDFLEVTGVLSLVSEGFNTTYAIDDGTGPALVFVDGTTGIDTAFINANYLGNEVSVRGASKCFNGEGEVLPREDGDFTLIAVPTVPTTWGTVKAKYGSN
jgi:hypothetical protein